MKILSLIFAILVMTLNAVAVTRVVVIDTGLNKHKFIPGTNGLCKSGHLDLTNSGMDDELGHGTNVSGLIHKHADGADYCQIIVKYYKVGLEPKVAVSNMIEALRYAVTLKPDIINISAGGPGYYLEEYSLVKKLLDSGVVIIAAAGNDGKMLNSNYCTPEKGCKLYTYFPASHDPRIIVVGMRYQTGDIYPGSNYGEAVDAWEVGVAVSGAYGGLEMTGTSQATAIHTGNYVRTFSTRIKNKK